MMDYANLLTQLLNMVKKTAKKVESKAKAALLDIATLKKRVVDHLGMPIDFESVFNDVYGIDDIKRICLKVVGKKVYATEMLVDSLREYERLMCHVSKAKGRWIEDGDGNQVFMVVEERRLVSLNEVWIEDDGGIPVCVRSPIREKSIKLSCKRSYQSVVDRCVLMGADRLLTLTMQENITDLKRANIAFKEFVRLCRKKWDGFQYVAVPEAQKRGAIHYHLALNKYYLVTSLLVIWRQALAKISGLTGGVFINKKATFNSVERVARYIAKYIIKGACALDSVVGFNGKRYYSSKNIPKPARISVFLSSTFAEFTRNSGYCGFISSITRLFCKKIDIKPFIDWRGLESVFIIFDLGGHVLESGSKAATLSKNKGNNVFLRGSG